jgi:hypothetical protein
VKGKIMPKLLKTLSFAMSIALLAVLGWEAFFAAPQVPLHDEAAAEHIGMLLIAGQILLIPLGLILRGGWKMAVLQAVSFGFVLGLIALGEAGVRQRVQARIDAAQPFPGGEQAARTYSEQENEGLGAVKSVAFVGVDNIGWDIYAVTFDKGVRHVHLYLGADSALLGVTMADSPTGCRSTEIYDCRYLDRPFRGIERRG